MGFASVLAVLVQRKARDSSSAQHQPSLQRIPALPELCLENQSCPKPTSLPGQGLLLTPWHQQLQLKFNELAKGLDTT